MLETPENEKKSDIEKNSNGLIKIKNSKRCEPSKINKADYEGLTLDELAPDGGWGYAVALGMIIVFVTTYGAGPSFAIVFSEFFESTGQSGSAMTVLNSIFMVSFSLSGLFTSALLKRYSIRFIGVGAAVLYSVPNVLTAFVTQVYQLAIIFFIQGIGVGLMNTICNANFNSYFVKKRARVMSAAQAIIGLGGIIYPIVIEKMMAYYGFRGTAVLIGVISMNSIVGMLIMHPVEWHFRDPNEVREEKRRLAEDKLKLVEKPSIIKIFHNSQSGGRRSTIHGTQILSQQSRWSSLGNLKENYENNSPLHAETLKGGIPFNNDIENGHRPRSHSIRIALAKRLPTLSASSYGNIAIASSEVHHRVEKLSEHLEEKNGNLESQALLEKFGTPVAENAKIKKEKEEEQFGFLETISEMFELSLLKDRTFVIMSLGVSFVFVSDFTFLALFPLAMIHDGYSNSETALTITVAAAAELVSRIFLAIFTLFFNARAKTMFFFAMISMGFAKFAYFYYEDTMTGIMVSMVALGAVRSWIYVPQPLVIVEDYPVEKYVACYGVFSLISGVIIIVLGPIIGFIKDVTNSFPICQLVLIAVNCAFVVPWGMELAVDYGKERKNKKHENSRTKNENVKTPANH